MEFCLKLMKVMEKSWNFEIIAKSPGKVMEFDKPVLHVYKSPLLRSKKIQRTGFVLILYGHGILSYGHGKVMEFYHVNFVATLSLFVNFRFSQRYKNCLVVLQVNQ